MSVMTAAELERFMAREFRQMDHLNLGVEAVASGFVQVRAGIDDRHLRPGGAVAGPTMMALADASIYLALLATLGEVTEAVTTTLTINFLNRAEPGDLVAEARLLKVGRRLAMGEVLIRSDGAADPVAHVTATYALPSRAG
jgi:uncharacterized protein (TIGR00369 family)